MCVGYHVAPHGDRPHVYASVSYPVGDPPAYLSIAGTTYVQVMRCGFDGRCSLCGFEGDAYRFCPGCGAEIEGNT